MSTCQLLTQHNVLFFEKGVDSNLDERSALLAAHFCGQVINELPELWPLLQCEKPRQVYLAGHLSTQQLETIESRAAVGVCILLVQDYVHLEDATSIPPNILSASSIPVNVANFGVLFPRFFEGTHHFEAVQQQHEFQTLTESNKQGTALRTGVYISNVHRAENGTSFQLLRCSSNLSGPTNNFKDIDHEILGATHAVLPFFFENAFPPNHVLAQVYHNRADGTRVRKASIKAHADKTRDMPPNAVIAFSTFYSPDLLDDVAAKDACNDKDYLAQFDRRAQGKHTSQSCATQQPSRLPRLRFALKDPEAHPDLAPHVDVTLYPNSLLVIPLATNRLYTHQIRPSPLGATQMDQMPTRLGYIMRCSECTGVHKNGCTYIADTKGVEHALATPTDESMADMKRQYLQENRTEDVMVYPEDFTSMNGGDFMEPLV